MAHGALLPIDLTIGTPPIKVASPGRGTPEKYFSISGLKGDIMPKQLTQGARLKLREIEASDSELKKRLWAWPEEKRLTWMLGCILIQRPHQLRSLATDVVLLADLKKNPPPK